MKTGCKVDKVLSNKASTSREVEFHEVPAQDL